MFDHILQLLDIRIHLVNLFQMRLDRKICVWIMGSEQYAVVRWAAGREPTLDIITEATFCPFWVPSVGEKCVQMRDMNGACMFTIKWVWPWDFFYSNVHLLWSSLTAVVNSEDWLPMSAYCTKIRRPSKKENEDKEERTMGKKQRRRQQKRQGYLREGTLPN